MMNEIFVTKASGKKTAFDPQKLKTSLERSGANKETIAAVLEEVNTFLYPGISTQKIYKTAFRLLKKKGSHLAAKYHLKQGIMQLGPSGFPFENFVAEILKHQGHKVNTGEVLQGKCVKHEIDVFAKKDHHCFIIECKYHNLPGIVCDVKIPLYIHSRFRDVETEFMKLPSNKDIFFQGWVVTNTKFTTDAITYGTCAGLRLLGWDYPLKDSLKEQIDELKLYPITCLTTLTNDEKQKLLNLKIVLCKEIQNNVNQLESLGISPKRINTILKETASLCEALNNEQTIPAQTK